MSINNEDPMEEVFERLKYVSQTDMNEKERLNYVNKTLKLAISAVGKMNFMTQTEYMNVQEELSKIDSDEEQNKYMKNVLKFIRDKKKGGKRKTKKSKKSLNKTKKNKNKRYRGGRMIARKFYKRFI
tara:strand:+ start:392 stop:772 length:381 start_codon:yes stop_codon:yes gene_type:complete